MKKLAIIIGLALAGITYAQDSTVVTNAPDSMATNAPTIVVTTITNITSRIQPIKLTAAQMDGIIQMIQASGISANVPIASTNLAGLSVVKIGDGFVVNMRLK
jgi:hypothetical protein